jgi:hypothetical protein
MTYAVGGIIIIYESIRYEMTCLLLTYFALEYAIKKIQRFRRDWNWFKLGGNLSQATINTMKNTQILLQASKEIGLEVNVDEIK